MKRLRLLGLMCAALLTGCTAPSAIPASQDATPSQSTATATPSPKAAVPSVSAPAPGTESPTGPFPAGSAVCNDSLTDSNPLNIANATLRSDGKTLSVLVTLDSPYPLHTGRVFTLFVGRVQHQADYTVSIEQTATGGASASVTDDREGSTVQVPGAQASITDQRVSAQIPASDFPRITGHFLWKVEASANGNGYDICPNENSAGVRVWLNFPDS